MRIIFYTIFLFVGFLCASFAETDKSIEFISVSQGLPNSQITQLFIGQKGLMWIGTSNGLCIYDGYSFITKQSIPFDSTTLADDNVIRIAQDRNSDIWLLTHYGLEFLSAKDLSNKRIKYLPDRTGIVEIIPSLISDYVYLVFKDRIQKFNIKTLKEETLKISLDFPIESAVHSMGFIYLLNNKRLVRFNLTSEIIEPLNLDISSSVSTNSLCLNSFDSKHLIFSIGDKLFLYDINSSDSKLIETFEGEIIRITRQTNNKIAVSTRTSIYLVSIDTEFNVSSTDKLYSSKDLVVNSLMQDDKNIVWAATNMGILKINPYSRYIHHNALSESKINGKYIQDIVIESAQKGYIIKSTQNGFTYYNSVASESFNFRLENIPGSCLLDDNSLYIGTTNGLYTIGIKNREVTKIKLFDDINIHSIKQLDDEIWLATNKGIFLNRGDGFKKICNEVIYKFIVTKKELYFTNDSGFGVINFNNCNADLLLNESNSNEFLRILDLMQSYDGKIWLATEDGLYRFNPQGLIEQTELFSLVFKGKVYSLIEAKELPEVWFATDMGIGCVDYQSGRILFLGYEDGVRQVSFLSGGTYQGINGEINFIGQNEIIRFFPDSIFRNSKTPEIVISCVSYIGKRETVKHLVPSCDTIIVSPDIQYVELNLTTLDYFAPLHTQFEYSIADNSKKDKWQNLNGNTLSLGGMPAGVYKIKIKAKNSHGVKSSKIKNITVVIKAPVLQSKMAFFIYLISLIFIVLILIRFRTRSLRKINREYREKERIAKKIEQQKEELSVKNKNITDSINYARRIQVAMMPSLKHFKALFPDSFILHMPKDIVSGDFYWVNQVSDKTFLSAVDCTGHGVPGAFMSIIGVELFRRITEVEKISAPAEILNSLSKNFERVFGDVDEMKLRDGMDLAFCSINEEHTILEFAGAFNPLYIIRDSSIIEVKGDRQSVGVYQEDDEVHSFTNHVLPLQDGDLIYIFTDGFVDQFGGPEGKKYKYRRFRHLLLALHQLPMDKQQEFLRKSILEWKGESDQVDDILVLGLRIHHNK